ncbi:P-loop containing nucleoside triphosphate hydrolase [Arabidopsis thaliana x Arabidopsis arenosa]|uniref:P-loop containing nucleoside triphosphate hydrolase n=1 Tax=Arabidopsis thaliana x Arabidopsis arenosa TaxID=1240361 RepID=A0A8T1XFP6_9BRAS|nr:P-loop containing nucleoside triphosphate hydrolase [Arabidopsis thaliana x Arabidopsis arenosa]
MSRAASSRILKDSNGDIGEHLRNHIHLTNCIHLKNHMHNNKQSPVLNDRSLLMRDLVVLQRSRSLRDPSASPKLREDHKDSREGRRRSGLRLSGSSPIVSFGTSKVTPSDEKFDRSSRNSYRVEDVNEVYSVASVKSVSKDRVNKVNEGIFKTLSDQLNEVRGDSDDLVSCNVGPRGNGRKRRKFRGTRRAGRAVIVRESVGNESEMSIASNSVPRGEKYEGEEGGGRHREQNMSGAVPRNGCGIPFNWSRIHHRGKTFLDIAGRSLSCGMSDSKGRKGELGMPMLSDSSSSDREALPLLVDSAENEEWVHDYSGELGIFADNLLKNGKDSGFGKKSSRKNARWHQSFTQQYAPRTFRDLLGQNLVVQALSNAVAKRRVGLLYVFHGPNGTGKTSCARIFARALNCHSTEHSKPCGVCSSCVSYDDGKNRYIREMGPVKSFDFENLLDKMNIRQQQRQQLVFIFDDCDTMSTDCWNALSKIVDRAPRRVVFILVCSSLDVLPHIIVSRCQKFFFPKLKDADIIDSLQLIASKEEIDIDKDALKLVASRSDGSLRDAEMTLEQLSLLGTRISVPLVQEMVGLISDEKLVDLLDLALSADTVNTVKNLRLIMETGLEPLALMSQLATVITDILAGSYDFTKDQCKRKFFRRQPLFKENMEKLKQALRTLSESEKQLRVSNDKLTWLTAALLQLAPDKQYLLPHSSSADASFNHTPITDSDPSNDAVAGTRRDGSKQGFSCKNRPSVEDIWLAVIEKVRVNGLKEFLYKEGKIFSISIGSAPTVQLIFNSPIAKSTAENFKDNILKAFEAVLGSPVTLEFRTESKKEPKNVGLSPLRGLSNGERFRESGRSEIIEVAESESPMTRTRRKHLESSQNHNQNQSIVRGKVSLAQVIKQAEGNSWSKHKAVEIANKLEQENLKLEPRSRSLICWKPSRSTRRKLSRLKVRTRRIRLHSLLKLVSCGKCLSTRSSIRY